MPVSLPISEELIFQCMCCLHDCDPFFNIKLPSEVITFGVYERDHEPFHVFFCGCELSPQPSWIQNCRVDS